MFNVLEMNFGETIKQKNFDPFDVQIFILEVSSSFYAQFEQLVRTKVDKWLAENGVDLTL